MSTLREERALREALARAISAAEVLVEKAWVRSDPSRWRCALVVVGLLHQCIAWIEATDRAERDES